MMNNDKERSNIKQRSPDLINTEIAMKRAAIKARKIAEQTGTAVVTSENNVIREEYPEQISAERK